MLYKDQIDKNRIPQHVAIIMDGNGRWAKARNLSRSVGHQAGAETVHTVTETAVRMGLTYLTLYTFSTENWNRPEQEISALMHLLIEHIEEETFMKNNVQFRTIGNFSKLPQHVQESLQSCIDRTSVNTGMILNLALSYSSKWELTQATKEIAKSIQQKELTIDAITEETIAQHLTTCSMPDPELLIRTGGELRLSNYLLWQCAYSELYFCDTYWPDFKEEEFYKAIVDYQKRERRFGKTSEQL